MKKHSIDDRQYERFRYRCYATLTATQQTWPGHLLNISAKGILVAVLETPRLKIGQKMTVKLDLEGKESLELHGEVAHIKDHYIGMHCTPVSQLDKLKLRLELENCKQENNPV